MSYIWLLLGLLCLAAPASAQDASTANDQVLYERAVDEVNCETIKFIHREVGRDNVASGLECQYPAISKSIPIDETRTTGKLADDIEAFKKKYRADDALEAQIDKVIGFATGKVALRKRKNSVDAYKARLKDIKARILEKQAGAAAPAGEDASSEAGGDEMPMGDEPGIALGEEEDAPGNGTPLISWISLILALAALGIGLAAFARARKGGGAAPAGGNSIRHAKLHDLEEEIIRLRAQVTGLLAREDQRGGSAATDAGASDVKPYYTGSPLSPDALKVEKETPEPEEEPEKPEEKSRTDYMPEEMAANTAKPADTIPQETPPASTPGRIAHTLDIEADEEEYEEEDAAGQEGPEAAGDEEDEEIEMPEELPRNTIRSAPEEAPASPDLENTGRENYSPQEPENKPEEQKEDMPASGNSPVTGAATGHAPLEGSAIHTAMTNSPAGKKDEDSGFEGDGEAMPTYMYAGVPADAGFYESALTDAPLKESVYEVEMYEDVPNKAFFSLLPYPEVVKMALENPDKYLAPCCYYSDDPAGKKTIVLVEEGVLRKEGSVWKVYQKANIKFK